MVFVMVLVSVMALVLVVVAGQVTVAITVTVPVGLLALLRTSKKLVGGGVVDQRLVGDGLGAAHARSARRFQATLRAWSIPWTASFQPVM